MCVERTASTKLPSARESRASVARQYRAAACAVMSCANLVCVWLMFNKLKVTQAQKQIYPQSVGQTNWEKRGPAATRDRWDRKGLATASGCLRFVRLATAFGEAAWSAAVFWWFVRAAVESFGVAAFAEFLLWRVSAGQVLGSFLSCVL